MNTRGSGMSQLSLSRFEKVQGFDGAFTPSVKSLRAAASGGGEAIGGSTVSGAGRLRRRRWIVDKSEEEEMYSYSSVCMCCEECAAVE